MDRNVGDRFAGSGRVCESVERPCGLGKESSARLGQMKRNRQGCRQDEVAELCNQSCHPERACVGGQVSLKALCRLRVCGGMLGGLGRSNVGECRAVSGESA
jgi:hypothetical protein